MILAYKSILVCCHSPCRRPFGMNLTVSVKFEFDLLRSWAARSPLSICIRVYIYILCFFFSIFVWSILISSLTKKLFQICWKWAVPSLSLSLTSSLRVLCLFSTLTQENWLDSAFELQICHSFMWQMKQLHHNKFPKRMKFL